MPHQPATLARSRGIVSRRARRTPLPARSLQCSRVAAWRRGPLRGLCA